MPLPHTLTGMIGFIVAVLFLVGISINQDVTGDLQDFGNNMQLAMNTTNDLGVVGIGAGFVFGSVNVASLILNLLNTFPTMIVSLPPEGQLIFVFMNVFVIVAAIKLIRGVWDY